MKETICIIIESIMLVMILISEYLPFSKCEHNGILHAMAERFKKTLYINIKIKNDERYKENEKQK